MRKAVVLAWMIVVAPTDLRAQEPGSKPGGYSAPNPANKQEALSHFKAGVAHFDRQEWAAALAEFLLSHDLYPTRAATKNAAVCLRHEGRFDEALDMYEELLQRYPDLSAQDRDTAKREIDDLKSSIGTVEIRVVLAGAAVTIDGRHRGMTPLADPLRVAAGSHFVRVSKEGYVPFEASIDVAGRQSLVIEAQLLARPQTDGRHENPSPAPAPAPMHDASSAEPAPRSSPEVERELRSKFVLEAAASVGWAQAFGGDVVDQCRSPCSVGPPFGVRGVVHGAYRLGMGVGFTLDAGYLALLANPSGRPAQIQPVGLPAANQGSFNDALRLAGPTIGASVFFHWGEQWPVTFRLGFGAMFASMRDARTGTFTNSVPDRYTVDITKSDSTTYALLVPEVRIGRRLGSGWEASVGVEAMLLVTSAQPRFPTNLPVFTGSATSTVNSRGDGEGQLAGGETLAGKVIFATLPSLALGYEF